MPYKIVVIGASAGGIEALKGLVAQLPGDFNATLFVTLHIPSNIPSLLPLILSKAGLLQAGHPRQGEPIRRGCIYVAPPDHHLILRPGLIHLARGPKENGSRPAIDPMFRSAARIYRSRVIGILLSGALDDGTAGLGTIKGTGGVTLVQDPADAQFGDMPRNAIDAGVVDHVAPLHEMADLLKKLVRGGLQDAGQEEEAMADSADEVTGSDNPPQEATDFTCPDCGGVLRIVVGDGNVTHYRCHVGHAWSTENLRSAQIQRIEESLWVALRTLEENRKLVQRMHDDAAARKLARLANRYRERLQELERHAAQIHELLMQGPGQQPATMIEGAGSGPDEGA